MALQEKKSSKQKSAHTWYFLIQVSVFEKGKKSISLYFFQSLSELGKIKDYYEKNS